MFGKERNGKTFLTLSLDYMVHINVHGILDVFCFDCS
jgi:hypothetical protein